MKTLLCVLGIILTILSTGCVDINYLGQEFDPLPEKSEVKIYQNKHYNDRSHFKTSFSRAH